jgi:hypothetical protein
MLSSPSVRRKRDALRFVRRVFEYTVTVGVALFCSYCILLGRW